VDPLSKHHQSKSVIGRDFVVQRAISGGSWRGKYWKAEVDWRTDLLEEGSEGNGPSIDVIYHYLNYPGVNHGIEQDGRVAVLTVHRLYDHEYPWQSK
jgi:hypothetical protein